MSTPNRSLVIATRGSALALAQANQVLEQCRRAFPELRFEIKILKTTGDRLQSASMAKPAASLPKGLFTKELELALLDRQADLAVHSLKDLPTDLPTGLKLGAVGRRVDARDVLVFREAGGAARRGFGPGTTLQSLPGPEIGDRGKLHDYQRRHCPIARKERPLRQGWSAARLLGLSTSRWA